MEAGEDGFIQLAVSVGRPPSVLAVESPLQVLLTGRNLLDRIPKRHRDAHGTRRVHEQAERDVGLSSVIASLAFPDRSITQSQPARTGQRTHQSPCSRRFLDIKRSTNIRTPPPGYPANTKSGFRDLAEPGQTLSLPHRPKPVSVYTRANCKGGRIW